MMNMDAALLSQVPITSLIKSPPLSVLLIDDQIIIAEAIRRMIADEKDIYFHYCSDPFMAAEKVAEVKPTVILQDLVMPNFDGLLLVKYFKSNPATKDIPLVVLSAKEDPEIKAEAFALGGNDYVVKLPDQLELIARIRYHSKAYISLLERNDAYKKLEESQKILLGELAEAAEYVRSLLPQPFSNELMTISWKFIPSAQLGGDAFGYHWLDDQYFAIYLLDVCGHGVGAALLSISIINLLHSQNLPQINFKDPSSVLKHLNSIFQMEKHHNMFFTIWYGVYDRFSRRLTYGTGGHPPAVLITGKTIDQAHTLQLNSSGVIMGVLPTVDFHNASCVIEPYNRLYLFSDGVYEINKAQGGVFELAEFITLLESLPKKEIPSNLDHIVNFAQNLQGNKISFSDDFSIIEVIFNHII